MLIRDGELFGGDAEGAQVVESAIEDIAIDIAANAINAPHIGVLPEVPGALVCELTLIIMGYPEGILFELGCVQVVALKGIVGVDDGLAAVVLSNYFKPLANTVLYLLLALAATLLDIEYRWKIAWHKVYLRQIIIGLLLWTGARNIEMISSTYEAI